MEPEGVLIEKDISFSHTAPTIARWETYRSNLASERITRVVKTGFRESMTCILLEGKGVVPTISIFFFEGKRKAKARGD